MPHSLGSLAERVAALESHKDSIQELVQLLHDVQGALRIFIKLGKAVKWLAGFLLAISGISWVIHHFGQNP